MSEVLLPSRDAADAVPVHAVRPAEIETLGASLGGAAAAWIAAARFDASAGSVIVVPGSDGAIAAALLGLGTGDAGPLLAGALATALPAGRYRLASGFPDLQAAALAFALGAYRFDRYRTAKPRDVLLCEPEGIDAAELERIVAGVYLTRDLVNTPANDLGPAELAATAEALARRFGATFRQIVGDDLLAERFPLVHAVGMGSDRAPRLLDITWGDAAHPKVTLVGKGVCFDTGGLNIKTGNYMTLMKKDMGGAASVLGLARMILDAALPVRLRVIIPAVENAISGRAFRPGDVFRSRKGLSVEIGDTDAEGRLVLADALALATEDEPDLLVDLATLTGAARVAVGPDLPPFYTEDDAFAAEFAAAGLAVGDPVWRLPLWKPYARWLESKVADLNNISSAPFAGSITAALFLQRFAEGAKTWVHGDIYAWTPSARPGRPEGGEAQAIRALYAVIAARAAAGTLATA